MLLTGCATTSFDIGQADRSVAPSEAVEQITTLRNRELAWGGVIVAAKNLKDSPQFEILGYPLDERNRPDREAAPAGRFIAVHPGYLETADYTPGRLVTVVGELTDTRTGTVGEAQYTYPVLAAQRIHLWPKPSTASSGPRIHFGIGIGISR